MNGVRFKKDILFKYTASILSFLSALILFMIFSGLIFKSIPILRQDNIISSIFSTEWMPLKGKFGLLSFIFSTVVITSLSVLISFPLCLLSSIFLSEYAPKKAVYLADTIMDILAGLPSVIFGIWGIIIIVPIIRNYIAPFFNYSSAGYSIAAAAIVLAFMITPVMTHLLFEIFQSVEDELREAALSLGATKWESIKFVVIKKSLPGIFAAVVLCISRAFGETLAVLMVAGNSAKMPENIFSAGYPLPALIANNYGEMMSIPLYDSALMLSALFLFLIVTLFNVISKLILIKSYRKVSEFI